MIAEMIFMKIYQCSNINFQNSRSDYNVAVLKLQSKISFVVYNLDKSFRYWNRVRVIQLFPSSENKLPRPNVWNVPTRLLHLSSRIHSTFLLEFGEYWSYLAVPLSFSYRRRISALHCYAVVSRDIIRASSSYCDVIRRHPSANTLRSARVHVSHCARPTF